MVMLQSGIRRSIDPAETAGTRRAHCRGTVETLSFDDIMLFHDHVVVLPPRTTGKFSVRFSRRDLACIAHRVVGRTEQTE